MAKNPKQHSRAFETILTKMRTEKSVAGALSLFTATPTELGATAVKAARQKKPRS